MTVSFMWARLEYWAFRSVLDPCRKLEAGTEQNRPMTILSPARVSSQVCLLQLTVRAILERLEVVRGWEGARGCEQVDAHPPGEREEAVCWGQNSGSGVWRIAF